MFKYSFELKLRIVHEYIDGQIRCYALKAKYKISVTQIRRWVTEYHKHGELAFSKPRGRPRKGKTLPMNLKINLSKENLEFLEIQQENLRLRIENEYLKRLKRLQMEQQVKEKPNLFSSSK